MSHVIQNEPTFFCPKCLRRLGIEERSERKAGNIRMCKPCEKAIVAANRKLRMKK